MSLIKEPLDVDFVVDSMTFNKVEEKVISDLSKLTKQKRLSKTELTLKKGIS